jgi:nicotinate-nucleotide adenylyltransferase
LRRIGIYGGTFDPIHNGHLHVITQLISRSIVDQLILIPAGSPWLRESAPLAPGLNRLAMCELALSDLPDSIGGQVEVSDTEINRLGPTYTIDTVLEIKKSHPDDTLVLIVGTDAYAQFDKWHRHKELAKLVEIIIVDRPEFPGASTLDIGALNVSATAVRNGHTEMVPDSVATYIKESGLYASK